jgi:hypothetical protein
MKFVSTLAMIAFWVLGVVAIGVFGLPAAAGYGYAVIFYPGYDQQFVCSGHRNDPVTADDYRVFLLNRGCTLQDAIQEIAKEEGKDPRRLTALYRGEAGPGSADEVIELDALRAELDRSFKPFPDTGGCPPGQYCPPNTFWGDDIIGRLFANVGHNYLYYALPIFFGASSWARSTSPG